MAKVNVRVAVAVGQGREWLAKGDDVTSERDRMASAEGDLRGAEVEGAIACYWLTAELDIPAPREVAAKVEAKRG